MTAVSRAPRRSVIARAVRTLIAAVALALLAPVGIAHADRPLAMTSADVERLLAKVKAEYPGASILKIERERYEGGGNIEVYEVKLLRPDGKVLKLYYDAATLAPVAHHADGDDDESEHRRRKRQRGHW